MKVLLSIKPEFVEKILGGHKKYEYRRSIFKRSGIDCIVMYATRPTSQVIGEFAIDHIVKLRPAQLWHATKEHSGISKERFDAYFRRCNFGYAIKIGRIKRYSRMMDLKSLYGISAPQSFVYIE
jgi:predicted transcriptional regulator